MIIAWQFSTISKNQNNFLYIYSLSVLENLFKLFHSNLQDLKGKLASRTSKLYQLPLNFIIEALLYIQVLSNILVICDDPLLVA
ncbi:unnamed protein product [Rhizophagus irregularis]|nr:unnamed protein product [Rhizophagus irregularis]